MASPTLAESSKLGLDDLVSGVIENVVTVNPIYQVLPFASIRGNAKTYNRENVLGDVQVAAIDGTISAKAAATWSKVTSNLTTIVGDAEINGLLQAQDVGFPANNLTAVQIASKAKSVGRKYQDMFINGDDTTPGEFDGLRILVPSGQAVDAASNTLSFTYLDDMLHLVKSKGQDVDFLMMHGKALNKVKALLRGLGGTTAEYIEIRPGYKVLAYEGVPIFRNDWIPINLGGGTDETVVFAGNFDDGSEKVGVSGLTAELNMGIHVEDVGAAETKDNHIYRVKWYSGLALFSELGMSKIVNVKFA